MIHVHCRPSCFPLPLSAAVRQSESVRLNGGRAFRLVPVVQSRFLPATSVCSDVYGVAGAFADSISEVCSEVSVVAALSSAFVSAGSVSPGKVCREMITVCISFLSFRKKGVCSTIARNGKQIIHAKRKQSSSLGWDGKALQAHQRQGGSGFIPCGRHGFGFAHTARKESSEPINISSPQSQADRFISGTAYSIYYTLSI